MPRTCIFCGERPGSNEHLFPNWLNQPDIIPFEQTDEPPPASELARHIANEDGVTTTNWTAQEVASATTKLVCHTCNTGWMSQLEGDSKPILVPLIRGHVSTLSVDQQFLVATWATKTAIVVEATLSENADNFTLDEAQIVAQQVRPPASVNVVIAAVVGRIPPMHYSAAKVRMQIDGQDFCKFHFHTVQVGSVVFQIVRPIPPPTDYGALERLAIPRQIELPFELATYIFPPVGKCPWPPEAVLDWGAMENFSTRSVDMPDDWHIPDLVPPSQDDAG